MNKRRNNNRTKKHFLETDSQSMLLYQNLLKNEKYWRNSGQYYLAKEYEKRARKEGINPCDGRAPQFVEWLKEQFERTGLDYNYPEEEIESFFS